jgi:hypothetical protein
MHIGYVADHEKAAQPEECTLHEMLKPPAYRESVEKLRKIQKLNAFSRSYAFYNFSSFFVAYFFISLNFRIIYKKTEREWRALPKSYPVDKMRQ